MVFPGTFAIIAKCLMLAGLMNVLLFKQESHAQALPGWLDVATNGNTTPGKYTGVVAVVTCSLGFKYYVVSTCFASQNGYMGGILKITNEHQTRMFSQTDDLGALGYGTVTFRLLEHFQFTAKIPSFENGLVLHLVIKSGAGAILYKDDTRYFDSVRVRN